MFTRHVLYAFQVDQSLSLHECLPSYVVSKMTVESVDSKSTTDVVVVPAITVPAATLS